MANRLNELAEQAKHPVNKLTFQIDYEKFAKLIIEECGKIADEDDFLGLPSVAMKQHFGVE